MTKRNRVNTISNIVSFAVMFGIQYLCRLEYNRGFSDGQNSVNNATVTITNRARHFADVFTDGNMI